MFDLQCHGVRSQGVGEGSGVRGRVPAGEGCASDVFVCRDRSVVSAALPWREPFAPALRPLDAGSLSRDRLRPPRVSGRAQDEAIPSPA
jgi:hypothetical protein